MTATGCSASTGTGHGRCSSSIRAGLFASRARCPAISHGVSPTSPRRVGPGGRGAVLDGVIAVLDREGRPDLAGFGRRLAAGAAAAAELPAVYLCSDVLHLDGRSTLALAAGSSPRRAQRADRRRATSSRRRTTCADAARRSPRPPPEGAWWRCSRGARPLRTAPGSPRPTACASRSRIRRPASSRASSRAAGGTRLILGEHVAGRLTFAGQVDGPHDRLVAGWLAQHAAALRVTSAPLDGVQPVNATWLRPALTATVRHQGRSAGGALPGPGAARGPRRRRSRWCVQRPAVAGPIELHAGTRFSPTLLMPLPLGDAAVLPRASR